MMRRASLSYVSRLPALTHTMSNWDEILGTKIHNELLQRMRENRQWIVVEGFVGEESVTEVLRTHLLQEAEEFAEHRSRQVIGELKPHDPVRASRYWIRVTTPTTPFSPPLEPDPQPSSTSSDDLLCE